MNGARKRPISVRTQSSVLYLLQLHVLVFIASWPHSFSMVSVQLLLASVLPLYLILLQIGPMVVHCFESWRLFECGFRRCTLGILLSALHHPNSYPPQPERVEVPCFPLNQLWVEGDTISCEVPRSRSPRTITMYRDVIHIVQHQHLASFPRIGLDQWKTFVSIASSHLSS